MSADGRAAHRDFEDLIAFLAQQMAKTPITALLRIGWDTVGSIIERVVADRLDERRLDGLVMIGVDEISYRKGQRYLTSVADHATGAIVWTRPGRNAATLQGCFDERARLDPGGLNRHDRLPKSRRDGLPDAEICMTPSTSSPWSAAPSMMSAAPSGPRWQEHHAGRGGGSSTPAGRS